MPEFTADTVGMGTLRLLEAIRTADWPIRFYQAGSSEMYGRVAETPQYETTPVPPAQPVRRRQGVRPLDDDPVPRGVRPASPATASCSTTSRPAAAGPSSRARSPAASPRILAGTQQHAVPRQPRRRARLGLRAGVRRGDVADAPAADEPDDYVDRDRRDAHRARVRRRRVRPRRPRLGAPRAHRRALLPPDRGGRAAAATRQQGGPSASAGRPRTRSTELVRIMLEADLREAGLRPADLVRSDAVADASR